MNSSVCLCLLFLTTIDAGYYVLVLKVDDPMPMRLRLFDDKSQQFDLSLRMKEGEFRINIVDIPLIWTAKLEFRNGEVTELRLKPRRQPRLMTVYAPERIHLLIRHHLECARNFYGSSCSVHCVPSEHFSCGEGGDRLCLPGWRGENCSIAVNTCEEKTPCVHGRCELTGGDGFRCTCQRGFEGPLCERKTEFQQSVTVITSTSRDETVKNETTELIEKDISETTSHFPVLEATTTPPKYTTIDAIQTNENGFIQIVAFGVLAVFLVIILVSFAVIVSIRRERTEPTVLIPPPPKCPVPKVSVRQSPLRYTLSPTTCHRFSQPSLPSTIVPAFYMSQEDLTV